MSYKIYAGTQDDVDSWENRVCIYAPGSALETTKLISPTLTREFGKAGSLEFTIPLGNVAHSALQKLKTVVSVEQDGKEIWQGRIMNHEQDFLLRQKVYCEGELAYLNDTDVPPYTAKDVTIRQFLDFLCKNHTSLTDSYKSFRIGNVTVEGQKRYVPVAEKCYLKLDYKAGSPDPDGDYRQDWGLYAKSGNRLIENFSTVYSDYEEVQTPPEKSWKLNEIKTGADYLIWRTGDNQFTLRRNAISQGSKTYDAEQTIVTPSITTPIETYNFDGTIKVTKKDTESTTYSIKTEKDGTVNVYVNGVKSADYTPQLVEELHEFGDGKNYGKTWDILQSELVDVYGGYLVTRHETIPYPMFPGLYKRARYLDYVQDATERNVQGITFGTNLLDLTSYVKAEDIVTRVIAIGKKKSGWFLWETTNTLTATANDKTAQKLYGLITRYLVLDGTSNTQQSLQDEADMELGKHLRLADGITVKAVDLKDAGVDVDRIAFGKLTHIISAPHGIDVWINCNKLVEPLDNPDKKEFTFGKKFSSISDLQALSARKATTAYDLSRTLKGYASDAQSYALQTMEADDETV
uniref:Endopeptidase tail n=1 Tax=Caudovirales sp. ctqkh10 TaxID=2827637 RepID=A0A8S5S5E1_9CAUD|nr:MAG TPA: endopeptidase tail [Caudovirales sp. ctqkh10]